jgi:hypothetical protein
VWQHIARCENIRWINLLLGGKLEKHWLLRGEMIENACEEARLARGRSDRIHGYACKIEKPGKPRWFSREERKGRNSQRLCAGLLLPRFARSRMGSTGHANHPGLRHGLAIANAQFAAGSSQEMPRGKGPPDPRRQARLSAT